MNPAQIRPIAICIIERDGRILVAEGVDHAKDQTFYRPLGGGIEFGEHSSDTVRREIGEELGAEITNLRYIGMLENIFTYEGEPGHEIVMVYSGDFADHAIYDLALIDAAEDDATPFRAIWKRLDEFGSEAPLYPEGLLTLITRSRK